jgi:2-dehydro-3-deoxyglucarate aldolase/4-hydroxy-2-oxoheptanedioate aldolase
MTTPSVAGNVASTLEQGRVTSPPDPGRVTSPLDQGRLRSRLAAGEPTVGVFVGAASAVSAEVCAAAGVDWVLLDLEHGAGGEEQVGTVVLAAGAYGVPTVVRVESAARIRLGRVLDLGAAGVMLPRLDTAAEVGEAVRHLRYPPEGDRGVATYNRACRFGLDPGALERANAEVITVVQIESRRAVEQVEEIAAVEGVDVLFVGPRDLSHDLGVPGDTKAPSYLTALDRVRAAARQFEKGCGVLVPTGTAAADVHAQGWNFVAVSSDSSLLAAAVSNELARARASG